MCTHNLCFEQTNFLLKFFNFYILKNLCTLHGQVFVMLPVPDKGKNAIIATRKCQPLFTNYRHVKRREFRVLTTF